MKELKCIDVSMRYYADICHIKVWERGDPFPPIGMSVGVDTETELFSDVVRDPPIVVLGVFDNANKTCWIVYWYDVVEFMHQLCMRDTQQRYFNLGYDEPVLDNEDPEESLLAAIDAGRVRDMQVRIHCHEVATVGWIRGDLYSLAGCAKHFLNQILDKGDPNDPENSARMTFKRYNEDGTRYVITEEQAVYLAYDCITTWCLGQAVEEQPTEVQHTKGMVVLAHISINGAQVDPRIFDYLEHSLMTARDDYRLKLLTYGFPDPYKDTQREAKEVKDNLIREYKEFCALCGINAEVSQHVDQESDSVVYDIPKKQSLRLLLASLYNYSDSADDVEEGVAYVKWAFEDPKATYGKAAKELYAAVCEKYDILAFDAATKNIVMPALVGSTLKDINEQIKHGDVAQKGWDFEHAISTASDYMDEHPDWVTATEQIGPRKFFQEHVRKVMAQNPSLELETTPKSGDVKLTLKDRWRLEDNGVQDKFLDAFIDFNHCQKYLSTYLNRDMVKADQKIHPRFTNYLRTGRTSCTGPNLQNLPSRDKVYPLKNMFCPYDGMILCATDFSFIESP